MAVLAEGFTVIVRSATVAAKYPGGLEAYARDCPNATYCADAHLCRVGFMVLADAEAFVAHLEAKGLTACRGAAAEDIMLFDAEEGPRLPCAWLETARYRDVPIAWLTGTPTGDLHAPGGWSFDRALQRHSAAEIGERLEFVRRDGDVDVYREKVTGQELYAGRTTPPPRDDDRQQQLYKQACALIQGLILLHGEEPAPLTDDARRRLHEAVPLFEEVVRLNPGNWPAMWLLGKVCQRLEELEGALQWFARAHHVNPGQPDVAREAAIAAMDLGRPEEALPFCERAVEVSPDDAGLRANLALALLFSDKPEEAREVAADALQRDPKDEITGNLLRIIDEVLAGTRPCPRHVRDVT
jgi:tetratricopeptide (TPR) repeat protein